MPRIHVVIEPPRDTADEPVSLDTLDASTALLVADINAGNGRAELWDGDRRLARLVRRGTPGASYWEVD